MQERDATFQLHEQGISEAERAYIFQLLEESISGFTITQEVRDLRDESLIIQLQVAKWKKDFTRRFGEQLTESLQKQLDLGIERIRERNLPHQKPITDKISKDPISGDGALEESAKRVPTQRPTETLQRMKYEFKSAEEQDRLTESSFSIRSTSPSSERFVTFSSRADKNNLILAGFALVILSVLSVFMWVGLRHERERSAKMEGLAHRTLRANLDPAEVDGDLNLVVSGNDSEVHSEKSSGGTVYSAPTTYQTQGSQTYVPDILKQFPEKPANTPSEGNRLDPNLSAGYFLESLQDKITSARRNQDIKKQQSTKEAAKVKENQRQFFPQQQFVIHNNAKKFAVPDSLGVTSIPTNPVSKDVNSNNPSAQ
jgi:hypothetical protein